MFETSSESCAPNVRNVIARNMNKRINKKCVKNMKMLKIIKSLPNIRLEFKQRNNIQFVQENF